MQVIRPVGREAGAKKYDILSAMMAHALQGDQHRQRLVLRLMALVTTRYNWQRNELTMGQREMARLWCVDERTVKRDLARLRACGWLQVKRPGARGRVSVLALDLDRIMLDTRSAWSNIGEDFIARAGGRPEPAPEDSTVVPFRRAAAAAPESGAGGLWGAACQVLAQTDAPLYEAWLAGLQDGGCEAGCLTLVAPSRFHATYVRTHLLGRMLGVVRRLDGDVDRVRIDFMA